jgi:superfamily II DNA or RNA helicase
LGQSHYEEQKNQFSLYRFPQPPLWRKPQLGALAAVLAHWSLEDGMPAVVSMPTGSGKTAVAVALPYLAASHRVLVIVPTKELRRQTVAAFRSKTLLQDIGVLEGACVPIVHELVGRPTDWSALSAADVVVAIPNSISPSHFSEEAQSPRDFFDLLIVDEAHHAPAETWSAILQHFSEARSVLLTATPRRRDGRRLPGTNIFHYPLAKAIADGIYKPIQAELVPPAAGPIEDMDEAIANAAVKLITSTAHSTSSLLVRASSVKRAETLKSLYTNLGLQCDLVHSKLPAQDTEKILSAWRSGSLKAIVAVDMLGEGVDLPSLRVVAYHDKHKSTPATIQLIGRLARVNEEYPQPSVLIAAAEPEAMGDVKSTLQALYKEDAQWDELLPNIADRDVASERSEAQYLGTFTPAPPDVKLSAIKPAARVVILEAPMNSAFVPNFTTGEVPVTLRTGVLLGGCQVIYSGLNEAASMLLVLTSKRESPRWYVGDSGLESTIFDLHLFTWHRSSHTGLPALLLVNSADQRIVNAVREIIDPDQVLRNGDPGALQGTFDACERLSVSSVGVRNTYAGTRGAPSYAFFAGTDVERGLRDADTHTRALGHAIAQVEIPGSTTTAGFSAAKAKYWETRNLSLAGYEDWTAELTDRFWFQKRAGLRQLLPEVARGKRVQTIPSAPVLVVELNPKLAGKGWMLKDKPIEALELQPGKSSNRQDLIKLDLIDPQEPDVVLWEGAQDKDGRLVSCKSALFMSRGNGRQEDVANLMTSHPPNVYFSDGQTIHGNLVYAPIRPASSLPNNIAYVFDWDWSSTDFKLESKEGHNGGTIHHLIEAKLTRSHERGTLRWVLCNDGKGEIADHIVIELRSNQKPIVELWHAKAAGAKTSGVRVGDMQVVVQQAIKNRRNLVDRNFWKRLGQRFVGNESPRLHMVSGDSVDIFRAVCGLDPDRISWSLSERPPVVQGKIVVVQPGLSLSQLEKDLADGRKETFPGHIREFLTVLHDSTQGLADVQIVASP